MNAPLFDPATEGEQVHISSMAIGQALSHEPRPANRHSGHVRPVGSTPALTGDEQVLLRIFIARRGQCLCLATLERAFVTALHLGSLAGPVALDGIIASLSQKLRASDLRWRVVAVEGCGYILWH